MEISDVRVRLVKDVNQRLKAVCSVTLDREFVVRDVKIVEGTSGLFVAMPSRKLSVPCPTCRTQNHLRARYCNECGGKLPPARIPADADGREKAHRDIAHPITASCRESVQQRVLEAYQDECEQDEDADYAASDEDTEAGRGDSRGYDSATTDARAGGGGASSR
ncbi:MAG: SpoVG family protein, partial [Phycisphaerales bacterium]